MAVGRDIDYRSLVLVGILCCVLCGVVWGLSTSGVALGPYNYNWDGGSELRTQLNTQGTAVEIARSTSRYQHGNPDETVAIVMNPSEQYTQREQAQLSLFVSQGGTLLIASGDNETNALLSGLGVTTRIDGRQVRDEQNNYRSPALPRANDVTDHRWLTGVGELTLNNGTVLDPVDGNTLVNTSVLAYLDENANGTLDDTETVASRPVAAVEPIDEGAVIVVSDESIFTNAMLEQEGNRRFARNLGADHEHALLDYSHRSSLPPLTYAVIVLRSTPLAQFIVGVVGLGVLVAIYTVSGARIHDHFLGRHDEPLDVTVDEDTLAASLAERNPDWDHDRVRRVTKVIRQHETEDRGNE